MMVEHDPREDEGAPDVTVDEATPEVKRPPRYAVLLHNDDYTTMEFVTEVLMKFFHKNKEEAAQIMLHVHQKGQGIAGIYPYEIAETKVAQVIDYSRSKGFPLLCTAEPIDEV